MKLVEVITDTWVNVSEGPVTHVVRTPGGIRIYFTNNSISCPPKTKIEDVLAKLNGVNLAEMLEAEKARFEAGILPANDLKDLYND